MNSDNGCIPAVTSLHAITSRSLSPVKLAQTVTSSLLDLAGAELHVVHAANHLQGAERGEADTKGEHALVAALLEVGRVVGT